MKSPKDMRIIQIDVTNACVHQCSNCTRFCGHHKKPFFMNFETFKRAVDSLDGFVGTVGIMGGEPTLHPEFPRMARYLASRRSPKRNNPLIRPQWRFMDAIHDLEFDNTFPYPCGNGKRATVNGAGLWSAIGEGYKKYYEVIQDTIQYQAVNDHSNPMYHQPALVSRKELGIPDDEWVKLRDNCWVQNLWSATVTPKGAFFCEIAGALDMLTDGPGGWAIEPGWWQRSPEQFGDQLHWCEICGFACKTFTRDANEEFDDISPMWREKLEILHSPKLRAGKVHVMKIENGEIAEESKASSKAFSGGLHYTDSYDDRFNAEKTNLTYKRLVGIHVCHTKVDIEAAMKTRAYVESMHILAEEELMPDLKEMLKDTGSVFLYSAKDFGLGRVIYKVLYGADYNTYALVLDGNLYPEEVLANHLKKLVLNPGTLLYAEGNNSNGYFVIEGKAGAALLNGTAQSIREAGWDKMLSVCAIKDLRDLWQQKKVVAFEPGMARKSPTAKAQNGKRYAVYGAGREARCAIKRLRNAGCEFVLAVDSNREKWGTEIEGMEIKSPVKLLEEDFDMILIGSILYYPEIKAQLLSIGFKEENLAMV